MTLYDLTAEFQEILNNLDEQGEGEPTESLIAQLEEVEAQIKTKADGYVSLIKHYDALARAVNDEWHRLSRRQTMFSARARWLRQRLHSAMARMGETKIATTLNTIRIANNGGEQSVKIDVSLHDLDPAYQVKETVIKANTQAIRDDIKAGKSVRGCSLMERGSHLRIS